MSRIPRAGSAAVISEKKIAMLGNSMKATGGMAGVARIFRDRGALAAWNVCYISTWEGPGLARQVPVIVGALFRLLSLLLRRKVSLVHAHSASRGSFWRKSLFCALARSFGVPYIFHIHSGEFALFFNDECGPLAKRCVRRMLEGAVRVIVLAESWRAPIIEIAPGASVKVIGNPVELPADLPAYRDGATNVVFLGRLWKKKGVFDLVRAVPIVQKRVPEARFFLAGDGEIDAVRALAVSLGVSEAVQLPGWIDGPDKTSLLANAGVLVLPSYFEGLGLCVLEAMAHGVPVIASRVGGIPDLIENGKTGLLVDPGDVAGLAGGLVALLRDAELRKQLRVAAFERLRQGYSVEVIFESVRQCYFEAGVAVDRVPGDLALQWTDG
jgi:glycosyltransferase involved in cell wall biosynthesis